MHLVLTDRLSCPRCGPEFGLILLADRVEDRRVLEGKLGCSNCRDAFPVRGGFGDLRAPPRGALPAGRAGAPREPDLERAERLQALLGVAEGPGTLALVGAEAAHAEGLVRCIEGVEVVGLDADLARWPESPRVSRIVGRPGIPLFSGTLRGVVVDGGTGPAWIREAARVVARLSRVVVTDAPEDTAGILEDAGLDLLAAESGTVVAARG
ncbi:MAG: hypothetical protein PVJ02_08120 [Gemmatimonadota bacterium]|jgi:uncharacterized protein YbaR (Trm112 family)